MGEFMIGRVFRHLCAAALALAPLRPGVAAASEDCASAPTAFVEIEGVKLHYAEAGEGRPVVVIHGASANLCDLRLALQPFVDKKHRFVFFDRPGLGRSERPAKGHDPRVQAKLIHAGAERLGLERPLVLAHSYGGAVALAYALQFPNDISGLVLLAPVSHPWPGGVAWYNSVATTPVIGHVFRWFIVPLAGPYLSRGAISDGLPDDYYDRAGVRLLFRPKTFKANANDLTHLKSAVKEMSPRYGELKTPVRILTGEDDTTVSPVIHSMALAREAPNAKLTLFPGVGHFIQHQRAEQVFKAIAAFPNLPYASNEIPATSDNSANAAR